MKLSATIITFNEQANIARCLDSLQNIVDEIIVVDSFSTDETESICRQYGVKFIQEKFRGHIGQKNFAMDQATHDMILSLDADEALDEILKEGIQKIKEHTGADAYAFNRLNSYCGTFIHHGTWYPDRKIRLWDRRKGHWDGVNPHDLVVMQKGIRTKIIRGNLLHYTYRTQSEHVDQMNKFSTIAAQEAFTKGKRASTFVHLMLYPFFIFIKSYFLKLGFLDGTAGFMVAASGAYYRFLKYAKLKGLWNEVEKESKK